jgi:epoxyqueuosine reductase
MSFTESVKQFSLEHGADIVGILRCSDLPEHAENIQNILSSARSVVVLALRHNLSAIGSTNIQIMQMETSYTYQRISLIAKTVERFLDHQGYDTVAASAFLPVDMAEPKFGLKGEICWRRAAVRSGMGTYGQNNLLVTRDFGAAVRLAGVLTHAALEPDAPLSENLCNQCGQCVNACPGHALSGDGSLDKRRCGAQVMAYGFTQFRKTMATLAKGSQEDVDAVLNSFDLREIWQTFMTGNYYYCTQCMIQCSPRCQRASK